MKYRKTDLVHCLELAQLYREIQRLPTTLREVIIQRYMLGHSLQAIKERMELSLSASMVDFAEPARRSAVG